MATATQKSTFGASFLTFVDDHQYLALVAALAAALFTLLTSFQAVVGLLDWLELPRNVDLRDSIEFWIWGSIGAVVIFAAGFILRSFLWPVLTSAPLFVLSITTQGPYGSSLEEAFIGWMPRFFLIAAIVCAVFGGAGAVIGRYAADGKESSASANRWRARLITGLAVYTALAFLLAGATRAVDQESRPGTSRESTYGQWIYGVSASGDLLILGTGNGVVSLDPTTHAERWHFNPGEPVMNAPTIAGDRIYFGSHTTYVYALDLNGNELWRYDMDNWVFDSPTVSDGTVYVGSSAKFVALDAATGNEIWTFDLGTWVEISWSHEVVEGVIYLGTVHGELFALDAASGAEIWRYVVPTVSEQADATPGAYSASPWIRSAPVIVDGIVYFGCGDGFVYAVDAATGDEAWRFDSARSGHPTVAVADGIVYAVTHGNVYALDAQDGTPGWQAQVDGGVWYRPIVFNDLLVVGYDRVNGRLTGLDRATGDTRWTYVYSEDPEILYEFTLMALNDGTLYAGSTGQGLFALDAATGKLLWRTLGP